MSKQTPVRSVLYRYVHQLLSSDGIFAVCRSLIMTPVFFYTRGGAHLRALHTRGVQRRRFSAVLASLAIGLSLFATIAGNAVHQPTAYAAPADTINFQARLQTASGAIVPDGNYNIQFKLYSASTGGSALWTETYQNSASQGVQVVNGYVSVYLGSLTAFPSTIAWDQSTYVTMNIGGTSTGASPTYDGEMTPRLKLTAVPYAFQAKYATQLQATVGSTGTLSFTTLTATRTINLPDENGTVCIQSATTCGFVQLQASTPGTQQTGNLNISGTGILGGGASISGGLNNNTGNITNAGSITGIGANLTATGATTLAAGGTLTVGSSTQTTSLIGGASTTLAVGTGGNTTTLNFTAPSGANTITFPAATGTVQLAPASGSYLLQVPTTTAANTVTPTTNSVTGLTVNGTSGTAATAASIMQAGAALGLNVTSSSTGDAQNISLTNTTGSQTNGLAITRNGAGGTTTNLLNLTNTAGTATNGLTITSTTAIGNGINFTGAGGFTNLISAPNFTVTNAGAITSVGLNSGTGNIQGTGGLNITGLTTINITGTANTQIGNANGTFQLDSTAFDVSSAGALSGITTISASSTITGTTINGTTGINTGLTAGTQRIDSSGNLVNIGNITGTGAINLQTTGATALTLDAGGAAAINIGNTNASSVSIGKIGSTTTINGPLTVAAGQNLLMNGGAGTFTTGTGAVSLNGATTIAANQNLTMTIGTGTFTQTYSSTSASSAHSINVANTNTGAGVTIQGVNLSPTNTSTASSGTNVLNVLNFAAGTALGATDNTMGINFASATGYTNFLNTPTAVLTSGGALTGLTQLTVASGGATITSGNLVVSSGTITASSTITGTTINGTTGINTGASAGTQRIDSSGNLVNIGNITGTAGIAIQSGASGTISIGTVGTAATASTIQIATTSGNATQAVTIGASAAGGVSAANNTLTLEGGSTTTGIQIGNSAQAHGIQIGTGAAVQTLVIGSTNTTSSTAIQGGTTGSVNVGSVATSTLSSTINIATTSNATGTQTVGIGSVANAANATNIQGGTTGGINIGSVGTSTTGSTVKIATTSNATTAQAVTIGSSAANTGNITTIQGGTGLTALQLTTGTGAAGLAGGTLAITSGAGGTTSGSGGPINITTGAGAGTGSGGTLALAAGSGGSGLTGTGGAITLTAGDSLSTNGNGGNITITAGAKTGTGTAGVVNIQSSVAMNVYGNNQVTWNFLVGGNFLVGSSALMSGTTGAVELNTNTGSTGTITVGNSSGTGNTTLLQSKTTTINSPTINIGTTGSTITTGTGLFTQGGNFTFSGSNPRTITGPNSGDLTITTGNPGYGVKIVGATGTGSIFSQQDAGAVFIQGGNGSTYDYGGKVYIDAGTATLSNGTINIGTLSTSVITTIKGTSLVLTSNNFSLNGSGVVTLAGNQTADITTAGTNSITIKPSDTSAGSAGNLNLYAASQTYLGNAGNVNIQAGYTNWVTGGVVTIKGGRGGNGGGLAVNTSNKGGNVIIQAGDGGTSNGNGGDLTLDVGATNGSGTIGTLSIGSTTPANIFIGTASASTVQIGSATISVGTLTGTSQTVNVANIAPATGITNTVKIGNTASATTGTTAITIGATSTSTNGATTVTILAGNNSGSTVAGNSKGINMSLGNTASTVAVCSSLAAATSPTSGTAYELRDCSGAPTADYAEQYPVAQGTTYGDIVVTGTKMVNAYDVTDGVLDWDKVKGQVTELIKSSSQYQKNTIGIVSDNYGDFTSAGYNIKPEDNPMPVALNGRVPVNIAPDSEAIEPGDFITTSGTHAGKGTKATGAGYIVGKALEAWDPASGKTQVMVFVQNGFYPGPSMTSYIQNGGNASLSNLDVTGTANFGDINMSGVANLNELKVVTATVSGNLEVKGLLKVADIEVNGHIITKGDTPGIAAETNAGKDAVCSVSGNDTSGKITITTGSANWANGAQCTITFKKPYSSTPNPVISTGSTLGATTDVSNVKPYVDADTNAMKIMFNAADNAPHTYVFNYFNVQ